MAAVGPLSELPSHERTGSFGDEKGSYDKEKGGSGSIEVATSLPGDVYDDVRAMDLGEDGKERPIGNLPILLQLSLHGF